MSDKSGIEWTDATWNPVVGCSKVSPGCANCYAVGSVHRVALCQGEGSRYQALTMLRDNDQRDWTAKVDFFEERLLQPVRWRKPRLIFVNSQSDLFHEDLPDSTIDQIFAAMALAPHHVFQVLTKRADRMATYMCDRWREGYVLQAMRKLLSGMPKPSKTLTKRLDEFTWPLPNVALGVSVENQKVADERIPRLIETPAALRYLSCEPLLGQLKILGYLMQGLNPGLCLSCGKGHGFTRCPNYGGVAKQRDPRGAGDSGCTDFKRKYFAIGWVICGGESGDSARPLHPGWARSLRDQCGEAGVSFFHKQNGEFVSVSEVEGVGPHFKFPDGATVRRIGKAAAGRLLDGQEWSQFPELMKLGVTA